MEVKTVFKVLIGTIVLIVMGCLVVELFNVKVNSAKVRMQIDQASELALDYYSQETYKNLGNGGTGNMPAILNCDGSVYVDGNFYPTGTLEQVYNTMFLDNWATYTNGLYELSMMDMAGNHANWAYIRGYNGADFYYAKVTDFPDKNHTMFELYPDEMSVMIPDVYGTHPIGNRSKNMVPTLQIYSPYYHYYPYGNHLVDTIPFSILSDNMSQGIRDVSDEHVYLGRDGTRMAFANKNFLSMSWYMLNSGSVGGNWVRTDSDRYISLDRVSEGIHFNFIGGTNTYNLGEYIAKNCVTPLNQGIPYFDATALNKLFRYQLVCMLTESNNGAITGSNNESIRKDENGQYCIKVDGFCIYADRAKITELDYRVYDVRFQDQRRKIEDLTGTFIYGKEELVAGFNPNTQDGINAETLNCPFVFIVDIKYDVPMAYEGLTGFRRVFNFATSRHADGYGQFQTDMENRTTNAVVNDPTLGFTESLTRDKLDGVISGDVEGIYGMESLDNGTTVNTQSFTYQGNLRFEVIQ